jgi:hypothetical protein
MYEDHLPTSASFDGAADDSGADDAPIESDGLDMGLLSLIPCV